ncbi:hypothetical protein COL26b_006782 [Colletotrichum chrysophilum]|uniref:Uncharacterized protein n=1 Tax=Colletotrichum chrysophilum TaxID=1836956 RepID=A0AAD9ACY2_9PEZI|nr:uncharacterized protein COL26b_006782 [Colletotrichum chrysophilum]KAI8246788.1 hypothetical protein K4K55_003565 [Colletotrichum sp. SAR 10_96]KAI8294677.1 hypothetical protein K4K56_001440 [Colletotrichum sp. SAR 10_98]KAJ5018690.1 hypothetical protein K4K57_004154 [Colletotrichum sp. SAR 10_99]KAJ0374910.1 hypothetical protein COL26b_006782 [Colletotrichum chrysophilum]KAK1845833.1 hypothetical protein CCHR01_11511 [Colletotrichum chrysophilum]
MRFSWDLVAAALLFVGTNAANIRRQDEYVGDFRIWSEQVCAGSGNRGIWAITKGLTETCQPSFKAPDNIVKAVELNYMVEGCSLTVYSSNDCGEGAREVKIGACEETSDIEDNFLSFKVTCSA